MLQHPQNAAVVDRGTFGCYGGRRLLTDEQHHLGARDQHWESHMARKPSRALINERPLLYSYLKQHPVQQHKTKMQLSWFRVTNRLYFGGFPAE